MNSKNISEMNIDELREALSQKYGENWMNKILEDKENSDIVEDELIVALSAKMAVME